LLNACKLKPQVTLHLVVLLLVYTGLPFSRAIFLFFLFHQVRASVGHMAGAFTSWARDSALGPAVLNEVLKTGVTYELQQVRNSRLSALFVFAIEFATRMFLQ
jgi:hypothetical protein